jgi:PAS domain S-box-containing protein
VNLLVFFLVILLYREGKKTIIRDSSGRNRAEEEVRKLNEALEERVIERSAELFESEQRHRSLLEASADPIVVYDIEGRVTYLNPAFTQTFGWTFEELQGRHIDFVPEENWPETKAAIDRMRQGEKVQLFETRRSTKDGSILDIQLSTSLFQDRNELPAGNIVILRDVTESKRAEEVLRQAHHELEQRVEERTSELLRANELLRQEIEERKRAEEELSLQKTYFQHLFDNSPEASVILDDEDRIVDINKEFEKLFHYSIDEIKGKFINDLIVSEDLLDEARSLTQKTLQGQVVEKQTVRKSKGGSLVDVSILGYPITFNGEQIGVYAVYKDITERKQAAEERIRLATAVDQAAESVIISDKRGTIQYVNPSFERLSGFTKDDIVGRNFSVLKSDTHDEDFYKEMWQTISSGKAWAGQIGNRMKDGSVRQFETTISPIRDDSGAIVNFVSVNRDVTQEVALEAQLLQAQKMEAVGTLAGGIAHDFNNLLQVIQGYAEVLLRGVSEDPSKYEALQKIHRSAKKGAELTRQLLTFSRKVQSQRRPLNLNQEVEQVKNLLERTIPKMIEIELHLDKTPAIVSADPIQVEQALMNLAVNAMDAMSDGGKIIIETGRATLDEEFCQTHLGARPGEYVLLTISDTGHGMDKEILEHVFEPFYTTKEVGKGTGLGLAMVYGIVKTHEGYIICYSELDSGTTFKIYLPALGQGGHWREAGKGEDQLRGGDETILLVDDEEYIRELGVELLSDVGYKVLTATDGESALQLYRKDQQRIDLFILDLVIPGMGGKKCYEEILKINPQAKILIVSGYYSVNGPGKEAMEAGAKGFVGKPFDVSYMLKAVRDILDQD